jgi:hypothetical protein
MLHPMSPKLLRFLALACVALALAAGCGTGSANLKPKKTVAITLDPAKKTFTATARPLTQIDITLPPAEPGQVWQIAFHDPRYLKQLHEIKPSAAPGAGATVSFITAEVGMVVIRTRVRFLLMPRSGEREMAPIDQQEFVLTIQ